MCARWRLLVNIKQQGKKQYLQPAGRFCFYIVWHFSRYIFERARVRTRSFAYICIVFSIYFAPNAYWSSSLGCRLRVHYDEQIHNFLIYISLESALFGFLFFLSRMWKCFFSPRLLLLLCDSSFAIDIRAHATRTPEYPLFIKYFVIHSAANKWVIHGECIGNAAAFLQTVYRGVLEGIWLWWWLQFSHSCTQYTDTHNHVDLSHSLHIFLPISRCAFFVCSRLVPVA